MVYDSLLLLALLFLATALLLPFRGGEAVPPGTPWYVAWLTLWTFVWLGWSWTHGGQTLGMRAWRVRLVHLDAGPVTWKQALIRFAVAIPSLFLGGLGLWWTLWEPRRRSWYDLAAGTVMIRTPGD